MSIDAGAAMQIPEEENPVLQEIANAAPNIEQMPKTRRLLWKAHRENGVKLQTIADEAGISRSYLSGYLNDAKFKPSEKMLEKLEEYFKKNDYWYNEGLFEQKKVEGFIKEVTALPFIMSECLRRSLYVIEDTWERKNFGMITGPSGCGKTAAVKYWLEDKPENSEKSVFITANGTMTRKSILRRIAKELGMFAPADSDALIERICMELKANPKLIIIDEADQIGHEYKLETLRSLVDGASGCVGIVLIGNEDLEERIMSMAIDKRKLSRIHNRFGSNQKVKMPTTAEADQLLSNVNLTPGARNKLISIIQKTNGMGGYRVCQSTLQTLFLAIGNEQITEELLRSESLRTAVLSLNA